MSMLQEIHQKRLLLKKTKTIVTSPTGKRFIEDGNSDDSKATIVLLNDASYGFVVDTKPDTDAACIIDDFLYLGSQDAVNSNNIKIYKLTHILSIGIETPCIDCCVHLDIKYVPCLDLPDTNLFDLIIPQAIEFIENAFSQNGRVLVHCNAGVSRSSSIVIAYLMKQKKN